MNLNIKNKVFMVAGASSGLGLGIAHQLAAEGAKVSIASRTPDKIAQAASAISSETSTEIRGYVFDARKQESIHHWVQSTLNDFGHIDGVVINAGGPTPGSFDELDDKAWQNAFDLTLMSAVRLIRETLPALKVNGGSILTLTSSTIKEPVDYLTLSTVMRSGVAGLAKSLADQLAEDNIRINNLIPCSIQTDRMDALNQYIAGRSGTSRDQVRARIETDIPMGRYGSTEEFAKAATFLLSDAASYITGSSLAVDGGRMKSL
ncbi:3-oxoacyl-ACP reductase [Endozoicomonas montiporae]|uniref:3-oxoacyl-ACP reductase n=2 Tax=Endozoicomonas montiporae TaxID=1027273 RepID=A0A081N4U6_9GAMM|nr:SDR family oxidoreductase [Endozoicomonas montiporae]AMO57658.1 3-ketoacyl-ACP reductase [Endozoicomonas montiporae CL-33]KEQ13469.1 3-oxoacyl-ACP reductase [Endozoicomonas montiporae]